MIVFRCDASSVIGLGHLVRCRALAYALFQLGEKCTMIGPEQSYQTQMDERIFEHWISLQGGSLTPQQDVAKLMEVSQTLRATFAVLDSYRVDEDYQKSIKASGLKWLQFDGKAQQPFWADIILNINLQIKAESYQPILRNKSAELLLGADYAIVRPEFVMVKNEYCRQCKKVLVTFGGGDDLGAIQFVLDALLQTYEREVSFLIVSGENNPGNNKLRDWVKISTRERVTLHINPSNIAALMASCDVAIIAGGGTTYEVACLGLPMIIIAIVDNQVMQSTAWQERGAAIFLGLLSNTNEIYLQKVFAKLFENNDLRQVMSVRANGLVDGSGAQRVAQRILAVIKTKC